MQASQYVAFLTVLSYALIFGSTQDDPTQYQGKANSLRFICEVLSIIFVVFYLLKEIDQAERWVTRIVGLQIQVSQIFGKEEEAFTFHSVLHR